MGSCWLQCMHLLCLPCTGFVSVDAPCTTAFLSTLLLPTCITQVSTRLDVCCCWACIGQMPSVFCNVVLRQAP